MTYLFLDVIFSLILIISFIIGIKKGAIKIFLSLLSTICAAFLTYCFGTTVSSYIYGKFIEPSIINKIYSSLGSNSTSNEILPQFITNGAENFGIELDKLRLSDTVSKDDITNLVENNLRKPILGFVNIIVSIILFIILLIILKFVFNLFNKLVKHSFVNGINSFLGGAIGILNGAVIITIICFVLTLFYKNLVTVPSFISEESVNNSLFFRLFSYIF